MALITIGATTERARLLPAKAKVLPGGTVAFRFESASVTPLSWRVVGPGSMSADGVYAAPYAVSRATPSARVVATYAGREDVRFSAAEIELVPGVYPGAEDCLGEGQSWTAGVRGVDYTPVDRLPVATQSAEPSYPRWAEERGLKASFVVNALICRSGRLLDAWATWPPGETPIPAVEEAALDAVRQWSFTPASFRGSPRAIVIAVPMRFPPP